MTHPLSCSIRLLQLLAYPPYIDDESMRITELVSMSLSVQSRTASIVASQAYIDTVLRVLVVKAL